MESHSRSGGCLLKFVTYINAYLTYRTNNTTKHSVLDILYAEPSMQYFLETRRK